MLKATAGGGGKGMRLVENEKDFESWIRLDDGSVVENQPLHKLLMVLFQDYLYQ